MKTGRLRQIILHNTIPFSLKENKNNDLYFFSVLTVLYCTVTFFQQFVSSLSLHITVTPFWRLSTERKLCTLFCISRNTRMRYFHSNQSINKCRRQNCCKKVIFIFFEYKTYSRRFIKFIFNQWWQMDYPDCAFHTFWALTVLFTWQSKGQSQASRFHPKYLFRRRKSQHLNSQ